MLSSRARYLVGVAAAALAIAVRLLLDPFVGREVPYVTLLAAVALVSSYAGLGPAFVTLGATAVFAWYFILPPGYSWARPEAAPTAGLMIYLAMGALCAFAGHGVYRALLRSAKQEIEARSEGERFASIFNVSNVGMAQIDWTTHRFVRVNQALCAMTGYEPAELLDMTVDQLNHPDDREQNEELARRVARGQSAYEIEGRCLRKDGRTIWVHLNANVVRDRDGRPFRTFSVITEITRRKRAEEERAEALARVDALVRHAPIGIALFDSELRFIGANDGVEAMDGIPIRDHLGRTLPELLPEVGSKIEAHLRRVRETGEPELGIDLAARTPAAPGEERFWTTNYFPVIDRSGRVLGIGAMAIDVTARVLAERALRDSEQRFATMADSTPVMIWVTNAAGNIEFVNRAFREFFDVSEREMRKPGALRALVHPEDWPALVAQFQRALRDRSEFFAECRVRRANGSWRWIASYAAPRFSQEHVFLGHVGSNPDITELKHAEQALKDADRRKDEFLAILAHELRNPLAPIRTGLELLRVSGDKPETLARIRPMLERQVAHMVRLVDDLLDISRAASGRVHLERQLTPLSDVVQQAVETNRAAIAAAGLELSVRLPQEPCLIDVDPTRFVQVLSNLLHNATKFTDAGGRIDITAIVQHDPAGPSVLITVRDTGIGISSAALPHVFDLFVQADSGQRGKSGLGIGLALARRLVEMHGGRLTVESDGPGHGSAFTIRMPVRVEAGQAPAHESAAPQEGTMRRILIVDDNVDAADMLAALVQSLGGTAATANSGEDGLRRAATFHPDVVLLDIGMPGMDGFETCRRLRAEPFGRTPYVVALTGLAQEQDKARALAAGFDAHLTKPAEPRTLEKIITEVPAAR